MTLSKIFVAVALMQASCADISSSSQTQRFSQPVRGEATILGGITYILDVEPFTLNFYTDFSDSDRYEIEDFGKVDYGAFYQFSIAHRALDRWAYFDVYTTTHPVMIETGVKKARKINGEVDPTTGLRVLCAQVCYMVENSDGSKFVLKARKVKRGTWSVCDLESHGITERGSNGTCKK